MKMFRFASVVAAGMVAAGGALADAAEEIEALSSTFETAFNTGDAAGVAALYTEDAVIMPPDAPRIDGREGVQGVWQGVIDAGGADLDLVTEEVIDLGDTATELGMFTLTAPDGSGGRVSVNGKYIVVWKKDGEDWKLHWDIWNASP